MAATATATDSTDIRTKAVNTFLIAGAAMLGVIGVSVLVNWIDSKRLETAQ